MKHIFFSRPAKHVMLFCLTLTLLACGSEQMNLRSLAGYSKNKNDADSVALSGNSAPSGKHFNLNLIGVPKNKTATITTGNRIFMPLEGTTKVLLSQGADFLVLDGNGTDGSAAFQLPAPDADGDGITSYSVFARSLGKPNGSLKANTCASDIVSGETICSLETLVQVRTKGKSTFTNVSRELLSISADIDGDGIIDRASLFDPRLQDFFWSLDNQGLKLLQLRFVEVPTRL